MSNTQGTSLCGTTETTPELDPFAQFSFLPNKVNMKLKNELQIHEIIVLCQQTAGKERW